MLPLGTTDSRATERRQRRATEQSGGVQRAETTQLFGSGWDTVCVIHADDVMPLLLAAVPSFAEHWRALEDVQIACSHAEDIN